MTGLKIAAGVATVVMALSQLSRRSTALSAELVAGLVSPMPRK
ncbi:hypothetical protein ACLK11_12525 [Escherichia coli]